MKTKKYKIGNIDFRRVFPLRRAKGRVETEISQGETSKKESAEV